MEILSRDLESAVQQNFETEGARLPTGKWTPLKPSTIKRKKGNVSILKDSGILAGSIVRAFNDAEATAGVPHSLVHRAAIHQFGGEINIPPGDRILNFKKFRSGKKKGKVRFAKKEKASFSQKVLTKGHTIHIPARPFLAVNEDDVKAMKLHTQNYILK